MSRFKVTPVALITAIIVLASCTPAIQKNISSDYEQEVQPQDIAVFKPDMVLPEDAQKIGSIEIGDTGFTTDCSLTKVVNLAREKASQQGAHAIKLTNVNEPDLASTCYRINAYAYRYPTFNASEDTERLDITEKEVNKYLEDNKDHLDPIEGIWSLSGNIQTKYSDEEINKKNRYELAIIKKNFESNREFSIIIISSEREAWNKTGLVKGVAEATAYGDIYEIDWISANGTQETTNFKFEDEGLITGNFDNRVSETSVSLLKKYPRVESDDKESGEKKISKGTGFVVSESGLVATNEHVVSNSESVTIKFNGKESAKNYAAEVVISDKESDIAILAVKDKEFSGFREIPYGISDKYKSGQEVFTLGYPMTGVMGESLKVTEGIISSVDGPTEKNIFMQTSVPIQPGNSGGPLFNTNGNVVGITTATLSESATGVDPENVNYSIKSEHFESMVSILSDYKPENLENNRADTDLSEMVENFGKYICMVEAKIE